MKTKPGLLWASILLGITGPLAQGGTPVPVTNASFESPALAPDDYTNSLGGWTNPGSAGDSFIERITSVTAADGGQYLGLNPGGSVHQDVGLTYQANTIYLLRVSVGNRAGFSEAGNAARYTLTEPGGSVTVQRETSVFGDPANAFRDAPPLYLNTATITAFVDKPIRIRLSALGTPGDFTRRSHFDQVRLERGTAAAFTQVANTNDSGPGSLREALANAAVIPGPNTVTFGSWLSGQTIFLSSEITVSDSHGVTVDAGNVPGLTISGNSVVRLFALKSGGLILRRLTLANGVGLGSNNASGGAVRTLEGTAFAAYDCYFFNNSADRSGGAISSSGTTTLERCLVAYNFTRSDNGTNGCSGAVTNNGTLVARQCTFYNNFTFYGTTGGANAKSAGAIYSFGSGGLTLEHCTVSGNTAGGDGSVTKAAVIVTTTATVKYSILDGNFGGSDLLGVGASIVRSGANYIGNFSGGSFSGPLPLGSGLNLGVLANNGGRTMTMALLPGSAGINAAVGSTATVDQRGLFISGIPDLGAFELGARTSVIPRLSAPRSVTATGTRALIRGRSTNAVKVTFAVAGQRGEKRTFGPPARWRARILNIKRPLTRVSFRATSISGNRSTRIAVVRKR